MLVANSPHMWTPEVPRGAHVSSCLRILSGGHMGFWISPWGAEVGPAASRGCRKTIAVGVAQIMVSESGVHANRVMLTVSYFDEQVCGQICN